MKCKYVIVYSHVFLDFNFWIGKIMLKLCLTWNAVSVVRSKTCPWVLLLDSSALECYTCSYIVARGEKRAAKLHLVS